MNGQTIRLVGESQRTLALTSAPHSVSLNGMRHRDITCSKPCDHCGANFFRDKRCTWAHWHKARFCTRSCTAAYNTAQPSKRLPESQDFARWFNKGEGCWEWQGGRDGKGYGIFNRDGKAQRAPRVALRLAGREPTSKQYACHHCDNPSCVRPSHLYVGSPSQNSADAIRRGRNQHGAGHYASKLTEQDILVIRSSEKNGSTLAREYGVSRSNIIAIRQRKTWKKI